jgi:hypothetical protein
VTPEQFLDDSLSPSRKQAMKSICVDGAPPIFQMVALETKALTHRQQMKHLFLHDTIHSLSTHWQKASRSPVDFASAYPVQPCAGDASAARARQAGRRQPSFANIALACTVSPLPWLNSAP